jgi:NAD(P)-dependent dehydrogenase (short-subunit alcohol dehydrogenase family)
MFRLCKTLLPQMKKGGSIINTGSIQSFDPSPSLIAYASTKAAIVSFTRSLASLAIKQGVRVNAVAPGPVWTPLIPSTMSWWPQPDIGQSQLPAGLVPVGPNQPRLIRELNEPEGSERQWLMDNGLW